MDINVVVERAKEAFLEQGKHRPMLVTETRQGEATCLLFEVFPGGGKEQEFFLFETGRFFGQDHPEQRRRVAHLCLITEGWATKARRGEQRRQRPSKDPRRVEVLAVQVMDVAPARQVVTLIEIVRTGESVDLVPYAGPEPSEAMQLPAFLAGLESSALSDKEFGELIASLHAKRRR